MDWGEGGGVGGGWVRGRGRLMEVVGCVGGGGEWAAGGFRGRDGVASINKRGESSCPLARA